ncbi:MAG: hypothetical protein ACPLZH_03590 [Minisyncoccales bacterium]
MQTKRPIIIDFEKFLDIKVIEKFINILNIDEGRKSQLKERLPLLNDEEKIFLWKTLVDIYTLDEKEKRRKQK